MAANGHTNCVSLPTLKQPLALPMVVYAFLAKHLWRQGGSYIHI